MPKTPRLMLIDGNAIIHRAFHALPPMTTKSGELVNAVYGFTMILLKAIKDLEPTYCAVAFDLQAPTFRHKEFKEYKANRVKADQSLYDQIPRIKEVVQTLNLPIYEKEGFEADDIIGTLATQAKAKNIESVIVTGDLDTLQLVNHLVKVYTMRKGFTDTVIYDDDAVMERYGLTPEQFTDYKALRGDSSDNIPGMPGIGEKGATNLLQQYGTIDGILEHIDELPEKTQKSLSGNADQLELNKKLVKIVLDIPLELHLTHSMVEDYDREKAVKLFQELEFKSLLMRLPAAKTAPQSSHGTQIGLFSNSSQLPTPNSQLFKDHIITTEKDLDVLIKKLEKSSGFVIDTEQDFLHGNLIGLSFASDGKDAYYVPINHKNNGRYKCLDQKIVLEKLKPLLGNPSLPKIGHNIKYDYTNLRKYGIITNPLHFDTMIASYILNPGSRSHSLDSASFIELGFEKIPLTSLIGDKKQGSVTDAPLEKVARYSAEDAHCTFRLWQKFAPEIDGHNYQKLFYDLEMPLVKVLADMEITGIKLDVPYLNKLEKELHTRLKIIEAAIYKYADQSFNIASTQQLAEILYNKLKLSSSEVKKGKSGGYSTAADALEKLKNAHPIIAKISEFRELTKLLNTYIEALPKLVDKDSRLHTSFNQTITSTGRLSSSEPNLQNIPTRTDLGKDIRRAFVAEKGYTLISADYSQIELRVMAHLSQDKSMIDAFQTGRDIHGETSAKLNIDRRMAKVVNFSIIYGTSPYGLAQALEIDQHEAKRLIDGYFTAFPGVAHYMTDTVAKAKKDGYVETLLGRRRYIPEIYSSSAVVRNSAERAAINMPAQGSAADIMKLAMIDVAKYLKTLNSCHPEPNLSCHPEASSFCHPEASAEGSSLVRLLLQVHDELIVEVKDNFVPEISAKLKELMENCYKLDVPITVEVESGPNWADMK